MTKPIEEKQATEWQSMRLGDIADVQTGPFGSQLHKKDYVATGIPIITVEHLGENRILHNDLPLVSDEDLRRLSRYIMREGDIIFSRVGSVDRAVFVGKEEDGWLFSGRCLRVHVTDPGVDSRYLSFFLRMESTKRHIRSIAVGATMPSINTKLLSGIDIRLPSLSTQRSIASILGSFDDKIELNRQMNETLEQTAQALFKSWFVDFDPVRAKAEGRDTGLPKEIADLFPDSFEDSELGEIPRGWRVTPFADTVEIIGGGTPKTSESEYWNGDIPWFSVVDAPNGSDVFVIDTQKKITQAGINNSSTRLLPEGVTIVTARGTVGKIALVGTPMTMNQSCYGLQGKNKFYTYFSTRALISELQRHAHGSVFDTITRDTLAGIDVVMPCNELMNSFDLIVQPILDKIKTNLQESQTLSVMRDSLLPKLLSGEIKNVTYAAA